MAGKSVMLIAAVAAVVAVAAGAVVFSGVMDNDDEGTVTLKYRSPVVGDTKSTTSIEKVTDSDGTTYTKTVSQITLKSIEGDTYVTDNVDTISTSTDGKNYVFSDTDTYEDSDDTSYSSSGAMIKDLVADLIDSVIDGATQTSSEGTVSYFGATLAKETVYSKTYSDGTVTYVVKMSTESSNISTSWGKVATKVLNIDITMSISGDIGTGHFTLKLFCYDLDGEALPMKMTLDGDTSIRQSGVVNNSSMSAVKTVDACSYLSKA